MIRLLVFFAFVVMAMLACLAYAKREPNAGLPIVQSAFHPRQLMLFTPCPIAPNAPAPKERTA